MLPNYPVYINPVFALLAEIVTCCLLLLYLNLFLLTGICGDIFDERDVLFSLVVGGC